MLLEKVVDSKGLKLSKQPIKAQDTVGPSGMASNSCNIRHDVLW